MGMRFRRRGRLEQEVVWMPLRTGFRYARRQDLEEFEFDSATAGHLDDTLQEIDSYHRSAEALISDLPLA